MNDIKLVDIPRLVPEQANYFKLATRGLRDDRNTDQLHIANFVIKTTGEDTRSKLLTEGKLSTNAILFNSGKATIKGGADAILKEVSDAMNQSSSMRIKIVGHTDTDGTSASNLTLSKERAMTVKNTLVYKYDIAENRIEIHGAGEENPIADNSTANGKSQNRRVEFIKL
jgi:outer membrane protein OmpA-like peptidoglycan-associated protein